MVVAAVVLAAVKVEVLEVGVATAVALVTGVVAVVAGAWHA